MKIISSFFLVIIFLTTFTSLFTALGVVSAEAEPISHKSFSIYDFLGGMWQLNQQIYHTTAADGKDVGDSISNRLSDAMTPDFISTCTIEGRPGFPSSKAKYYGLPRDLDIGTGNSRVVACTLQINEKSWKVKSSVVAEYVKAAGKNGIVVADSDNNNNNNNNNNNTERTYTPKISTPLVPKTVGMKLPAVAGINVATQLFFVPSSMNSAQIYQITPLRDIKNKKELKFFEQKYKIPSTPAVSGDEDQSSPPSVFVVTHKGKLEIKHQFKILGDVGNKELSSIMSSVPSRAKHGFATGNAVLVPVYKKKENDDEDGDDSSSCSIQVTRVSAVITTKSDVLLNVAVRYSGGELCFGEEEEEEEKQEEPVSETPVKEGEPSLEAAASKTEKKTTKQKKSSSTSSSSHNVREVSENFLLNTKRFAELQDEDMILDPDTPWYMKAKFGPSIGAFVLLFIIIGGRKAVTWYLRRRGIDIDQFMKSTKQKTKEEIIKMRKERMMMKGGINTPMTDEEVAAAQILEQRQELEKMKQYTQEVKK